MPILEPVIVALPMPCDTSPATLIASPTSAIRGSKKPPTLVIIPPALANLLPTSPNFLPSPEKPPFFLKLLKNLPIILYHR